MEVVTFQSEVYKEFTGKLDAINHRLTAKEKEPKHQCQRMLFEPSVGIAQGSVLHYSLQ